MKNIKRTFTVEADPETLRKVESMLALMHFNCGHSHSFGMHFDGDGPFSLKVLSVDNEQEFSDFHRPSVRKVGDHYRRNRKMVIATGHDDSPFVIYNAILEKPTTLGAFGEKLNE